MALNAAELIVTYFPQYVHFVGAMSSLTNRVQHACVEARQNNIMHLFLGSILRGLIHLHS